MFVVVVVVVVVAVVVVVVVVVVRFAVQRRCNMYAPITPIRHRS